MAALGILYPNSPSTDSAAPLSSNRRNPCQRSLHLRMSLLLSLKLPLLPSRHSSFCSCSVFPSRRIQIGCRNFSALVASSSLSLKTEPPLSAYPMTYPSGGAGLHENINVRMLKNLKEAVTSSRIHSPYVMGLLDSLMDTNIVMLLYDWKSLFSMLLTPAQFVIWSSEYNKLADAEIF
ncbi:hypothetical protein E2320_006051 [Naja naja]|nr:hypothetical protein E2320_006051 [Naja naja]